MADRSWVASLLAKASAGVLTGTERLRLERSGASFSSTVDDVGDRAIGRHVAELDPHSQYLTETAAVTGYQPLDPDLTTLGAGGAPARSFLGLGTGDSPQFTAVNLGHASDTTLARVAAGEISVEGVPVPLVYATVAAAAAASPTTTAIRTLGYGAAGDLGGALYVYTASAPSHEAKVTCANGRVYAIAETVVTPYMLGAKPDGTTYTTQLQNWLDVVRLWPTPQYAPHLHLPRGQWVTGRLVYPQYMTLFGTNRRSSRIRLANSTNDHLFVPYHWANGSTSAGFPVDIRGIAFDGNKANQSSDKDCLVYSSFKGTVADCLFIDASRHGVLCTTKNEAGSNLTNGLADTLFMNNRYETCDYSGWYGEDGNNTLADILFINDIAASCGAAGYASFHSDRSSGFVLNQCRTYDGRSEYDVNLLKAGRTIVANGNFDFKAIGVATSVTHAAAIRMQTVGLAGQSHNQIIGNQIMLASALVDNGVTAYHGIYMDGGSNDLVVCGNNFAAHATVAAGRPIYISSTSYGAWSGNAISNAHTWPQASTLSSLTSLGSEAIDVAIADGGTGASTAAAARTNLLAPDTYLSGSSVTHTGDTNETTLATIALPVLGVQDRVEVECIVSLTNNGNNKTFRAKLASTTIQSLVLTTQQSYKMTTAFQNRNSASSQVAQAVATGSGGWGSGSAAVVTAAVNTATSQNITITVQLANGADSATLESYCVRVFRAA